MADEFDRINDPDFVSSAAKEEFSWEQRHREIVRERRKTRRAARRRAILSWRTLAIAALAAVAVTYVVKQRADDAGTTIPLSDSTATTDRPRLQARDFSKGECVLDQSANDSNVKVVPCDEPHRMEIAGVYTADPGPYPSLPEWDALTEVKCAPLVQELLGGPIDPFGRYRPGGFFPTPEGWALGDRRVWCGARSNIGRGGVMSPLFTGRARADNQFLINAVGSCGDLDYRGPLPCDQPHDFEIFGNVDLTGKVSQPPAMDDTAAWNRLLAGPCDAAAKTYLHGPVPAGMQTHLHFVAPESWAAGRRVAECALVKYENGVPVKATSSVRR